MMQTIDCFFPRGRQGSFHTAQSLTSLLIVLAWYTSTLIRDVIDTHAPVKSKLVKRQSVHYMNFWITESYL